MTTYNICIHIHSSFCAPVSCNLKIVFIIPFVFVTVVGPTDSSAGGKGCWRFAKRGRLRRRSCGLRLRILAPTPLRSPCIRLRGSRRNSSNYRSRRRSLLNLSGRDRCGRWWWGGLHSLVRRRSCWRTPRPSRFGLRRPRISLCRWNV